jgi:hypothetical protein
VGLDTPGTAVIGAPAARGIPDPGNHRLHVQITGALSAVDP